MAKGCKKKRVSFKVGSGRNKQTVSFQRKCSSPAQLKKKRSTRHLSVYKSIVKDAAPSCGRKYGYFNNQYGKCIKDAIKSVR